MSHPYMPQTPGDIRHMLETCGFRSLEHMLEAIPGTLRLSRPYDLPSQMGEPEVRRFFNNLAARCTPMACFAGNGFYAHWTPSAVASVMARSEFLTAYTPYQPEISQGTLHYIFEYQTIMARLTGLPVSNASLYDGATATAEAALMCVAAARKKNRILLVPTVLPAVAETVATYCSYHGIELTLLRETDGGTTDTADLDENLAKGDVAGVIAAYPNRYGILEDLTGWAGKIHAAKALLAINSPAGVLATVKSPGEWGADIAVGDGQSLGMPLDFGGPYLGYMTATQALVRKMPGRIVGATTDRHGRRCFVLTLQAREQHIRREKATSNICSNQGIMSLMATAYVSLMGRDGLDEVNRDGAAKAHALADALCATGRFRMSFPDAPYLNEFAVDTDLDIDTLLDNLARKKILGGVKIGPNRLLIAATEMVTQQDIDTYVSTAKE